MRRRPAVEETGIAFAPDGGLVVSATRTYVELSNADAAEGTLLRLDRQGRAVATFGTDGRVTDAVESFGDMRGGVTRLLPGGVPEVNGTLGRDDVSVTVRRDRDTLLLGVKVNAGRRLWFPRANVTGLLIHTGAGHDAVYVNPGLAGAYVQLGTGNDRFNGTDGSDTVVVGGGNDAIVGGRGDDQVLGALVDNPYDLETDTLLGGRGRDRLWGQLTGSRAYADDYDLLPDLTDGQDRATLS